MTSAVVAIDPETTPSTLHSRRNAAACARSRGKSFFASSIDIHFFRLYSATKVSCGFGSRGIISMSSRAHLLSSSVYHEARKVDMIASWLPNKTGSIIPALWSPITAMMTRISVDSGKRIRVHGGT